MKITFISDTHNKHDFLTSNKILGSGNVLVHAGDISSMGRPNEIMNFLEWFSNTDFEYKIFIAGNHDFGFQQGFKIPKSFKDKGVIYLQDSEVVIEGVKFYGSPWQPEFHNWAFNLPRGQELAEKWEMIPTDTNVLITHSPAMGMVDYTPQLINVGCNDLFYRIMEVRPQIHVCGHIHFSYGQKSFNGVDFINASVLDESYTYRNQPIVVDFNPETNEITYA